MQVFDANQQIIRDLQRRQARAGRAAAPRDLRPPVPALLALREPADPARRRLVVRRRSRVPRPDGRAEPADHLGARAHQGRPVRQVAGERARLVDLPQPVLGQPDPGVDLRRPALPAHGRLRLARRARARLRRAPDRPAPALRRRADPPEPGRPDRAARPCAGCRRCSTAGSSRARCRSRRCTTRSRTRTGSSTTTRATSSSSTTARPAAGSTRCTCWPRRCSTGRRSAPASRTGSCSATTAQKMSKSRKNYPDVNEVFDRDGSDAMRWFLMASPILRGGNLVVTEQGIREGVRQAILPLWNTWYFLSLYAERGRPRRARSAPTRRTCSTATCWRRPPTLVDERDRGAGRLRHRRRVRAGPRPRRGADQLVRAPVPGPVLGRRRRTRSTRCTRCWR